MVKRFERCAWARDKQSIRVPGLKVRYSIALQKLQEKGLPAQGGFLQRSAYRRSQNTVLLFKSMWQAMKGTEA